ncbi:hypothetical protein FALCPG4_010497 [Fusarium falciforme]
MSWGYPGGLRWLEWSKVTDVCPEAMIRWFELCYIERKMSPKCTPEEFVEIVAEEIAPLISVFYPSGELVHPPKQEGEEGSGGKGEAEAEGGKKEEAGIEGLMADGESSKKKKKKKSKKKKK